MRHAFTLIELMIVIAIIAIIAAIAIPNLLESRVTANEAAAGTSLKSGIFPAEVQFQGGGYQDADVDNVGEYGHLVDLTGARATTGVPLGSLKLLQGPLASGPNRTVAPGMLLTGNGYFYQGTTAAGAAAPDGVVMEGNPLAGMPFAAGFQFTQQSPERAFAVACVPQKYSDTGRRVFLIDNSGQLHSPAAFVNLTAWFPGDPSITANSIPTAGSFVTGYANALTVATDLASGVNLTTTPFYSK